MRRHVSAAKGSNLSKVKTINLSVVLNHIRSRGPISRTELAEVTDLTAATITNVVNQLAKLGLVSESGRVLSRGGGRYRVLLTLNESNYYTVGVEISRHHVQAVLVDLGGNVHAELFEEHDTGSPREVVERAARMVHALMQQNRNRRFVAVGIGVPGPVDISQGVVISPPNFPGWNWVPLRDQIAERIALPVYVDDDAKTAALGEAWFGAGVGAATMVYLTVGTGIGAGVVIDRVLYSGTHDLAGQIGHTTVDVDGPRCECNNVGCLETLASIPAIVRAARRRLREGAESALRDLPESDLAAAEAICKAALAGDPLASEVMERTIQYLGAAVINVVNLYDPEMIVVGGRLARLNETLVPRLRHLVRERAYSFASESVTLVPSVLQNKASSVGAAALAIQHLFEDPARFLERANVRQG